MVKRNVEHADTETHTLFLTMSHPSSLGSIAGEILEKEGRTERTQSLIRRAGLDVQISPVRPWPNASDRTLL